MLDGINVRQCDIKQVAKHILCCTYTLIHINQGPYSLTWIKLSEKSAQDQIKIKENGSADLWLKSVFTKEGSAGPKILKNST